MRRPSLDFAAARWIALAVALAAGYAWAADGPRVPRPAIKVETPGQCVDDPQVMRREHMNMLKHDRDLTMHQGIRKVKASLKACIDCHASRKTGSAIGGRDNFCQSCHEYVAVKLDCFECHSAKPRRLAATAGGATEAKP